MPFASMQKSATFKLFGAILDRDTGSLAGIFVEGAFVGILKTAPSAYVVNQDDFKICRFSLHVFNEALKSIPAVEA